MMKMPQSTTRAIAAGHTPASHKQSVALAQYVLQLQARLAKRDIPPKPPKPEPPKS